jgi:threonylcarbamoyladenosine tRNA methylthiotransferase MtaB
MRISISTLGCKLNQAESDSLARELSAQGHLVVPDSQPHDLFILNTCSVTSTAEAKSRHALTLENKRNPSSISIAIGCYAQRSPDILHAIPGIAAVIGNRDKARLLRILSERGLLTDAKTTENPTAHPRTRAFLKIQEGCNNHCSYCVVPQVRGSATSVPSEIVLAELARLESSGYREVVITGTEIGSYDDSALHIPKLISEMLNRSSIPRIRISSLQPFEITSDLLALWQDHRLCQHFHISLQSGSNSILGAMRRRYQVAHFEEAVRIIRTAIPAAAITTDIIVGFPGETENDFQQTLDVCRRIGFSRIHQFPYSPRPGTVAAQMESAVTPKERSDRLNRIKRLAEESNYAFTQAHIGHILPVLWEQQHDRDTWSGLTPDYLRVYVESEENITNRILSANIKTIYKDGVRGSLIDQ